MKCLNEKALSLYLDDNLSTSERKEIENHIADCNMCLDMLLVAHENYRVKDKKCSSALKREIKNKFVFKERKKMPELKWFFAGLIFLLFSFVFRHYFMQFLAIAVIFGFKWVMEGEGAKRVVMIFKGISEKEKKFERKLPSDVSNMTGGDRYGESE